MWLKFTLEYDWWSLDEVWIIPRMVWHRKSCDYNFWRSVSQFTPRMVWSSPMKKCERVVHFHLDWCNRHALQVATGAYDMRQAVTQGGHPQFTPGTDKYSRQTSDLSRKYLESYQIKSALIPSWRKTFIDSEFLRKIFWKPQGLMWRPSSESLLFKTMRFDVPSLEKREEVSAIFRKVFTWKQWYLKWSSVFRKIIW